MKYRKKPVVINAVCFTVKTKPKEIKEELGYDPVIVSSQGFFIETLEGMMKLSDGDYIIKGIQGEFYPCKPDIFHKTYEVVEGE